MKTIERGIKRRRPKLDWLIVEPTGRDDMDSIASAISGGIGTTFEEAFALGREHCRRGLGRKTYKCKKLRSAFNRGYSFQTRFKKK
jgi:hypothetical protein